MNYRHVFHAGNFADVFKHVFLTRILVYLIRKETPLRFIDTHAGAGRYDLDSEAARRSPEWPDGVGCDAEAQRAQAFGRWLADPQTNLVCLTHPAALPKAAEQIAQVRRERKPRSTGRISTAPRRCAAGEGSCLPTSIGWSTSEQPVAPAGRRLGVSSRSHGRRSPRAPDDGEVSGSFGTCEDIAHDPWHTVLDVRRPTAEAGSDQSDYLK